MHTHTHTHTKPVWMWWHTQSIPALQGSSREAEAEAGELSEFKDN